MSIRKVPAVPAPSEQGRTGPVSGGPIRSGKGRPDSVIGPSEADDYIPRLTPEERARQLAIEEQTRQLRELATADPQAMSRLLRVWLAQGKSGQGAADAITSDASDETGPA